LRLVATHRALIPRCLRTGSPRHPVIDHMSNVLRRRPTVNTTEAGNSVRALDRPGAVPRIEGAA